MTVNGLIRNIIAHIAVLTLLLAGIIGCAKPPTTYTMPPAEVEAFRAGISKVALVGGRYKTLPYIDLPAKGTLAAAGRGFVSGAGVTIAAGAVSPIPGGVIFGIILSPIGGVVGTIHGMANAEPSEKVEAVEAALLKASTRLDSMDLGGMIKDDFVKSGKAHTGLEFKFHENLGPRSETERPVYTPKEVGDADVVLEIRPLRTGLWGIWSVNPPSSPFVEIGVRLIRVSDNTILIDDVMKCVGEERTYDKWAENDGKLFVDEIIKCIPRLVEKVLDDVFRTYALSRRR